MKSEREIQSAIMVALGSMEGVRVFRLNVGLARSSQGHVVRFGMPGMADLLVLCQDRYLWIEVKSARGRQTPQQKNFEAAIKSIGGNYAVCRSVEDALEALEEARG